VKKFIFYF